MDYQRRHPKVSLKSIYSLSKKNANAIFIDMRVFDNNKIRYFEKHKQN